MHGLSGGKLARLARLTEVLYICGNPLLVYDIMLDFITKDGEIVTLDHYRERWPGLAFVHVPVPGANEDLAVWVHTCPKGDGSEFAVLYGLAEELDGLPQETR